MKRASFSFYLLAAFILLSCTRTLPALPKQETPQALPSIALAVRPLPRAPERDLYELTQRLRLRSSEPIPRVVKPENPRYEVGREDTFWVTDLEINRPFTVTAFLRLVTTHAYWYVERGLEGDQGGLERSGQEFEERIYPTLRRYFGGEPSPGFDVDPRLTILNARIPGAGGYYSVADEYPQIVNPHSNERGMIYVNMGAMRPGTSAYNSTLAHELQHAIHAHIDRNEETWVNEGLSVLAEELAGYGTGLYRAFIARPDTQLTSWSQEPRENPPHYGAAYLFFRYLAQHYGGYEALRDLVAEQADGIMGIDAFLARRGYAVRFQDVFKDWIIANYLDEPGEGSYSYPDLEVHAQIAETILPPAQRSATVHQYAANYIELRPAGAEATLLFTGTTNVKLLPNEPHSGSYQWWGNRGDAIDATLTHGFDLTGLERTTLSFWLWYDIEENWDHAYLELSADGGKTWTPLSGEHTTEENPLGNSYGPAYTGKSGGGSSPSWVEERVDLTPYAGGRILLRFEYVTDEAVTGAGFALDDLAIPELGYFDDAEGDGGWVAQGFLRIDNRLEQRFLVQVIKLAEKAIVETMPLDAENRGQLRLQGFGKDLSRAILVVSAMASLTTEPARYEYSSIP